MGKLMMISEVAVGLFTNLLSDTAKEKLGKLYTPSSKAYNKAVKELSKKYNLSEGEIDDYLRQKNVKMAVKEYLENPNNQGILKNLTDEFLSSLNRDIIFKTRASSILNEFFDILYSEIKKDPELRNFYELNIQEHIFQTVQEMHHDFKGMRKEINNTNNPQDTTLVYAKNIYERFTNFKNLACYIDLRCTDDAQNVVLIDKYIEKWLDEKEYPILAILGDFGTGKTTYVTNLIKQFSKRYIEDNNFYLPVLIELKNFTKVWNLEDLIKNNNIAYGLSIDDFSKKFRNGKILFVLDGFDELPKDTIEKFNEIYSRVSDRHKIVITSRTHYFKYKEDEKSSLNPPSIGDTGMSLKDEYKLKLIYVNLFMEDDIKKYLEKSFGNNCEDKYEIIKRIYNLSDLSRRPILLNIIVQTLPELSKVAGDINHSELYNIFTNKWMNREKKKDLDPKYVSVLMEDLAFKMFDENKSKITIDELYELIDRKFSAEIIKEKVNIDDFYKKIRAASFIYRDSDDNFTFMHKSFMEFFIAKKFSKEINKGIKDHNSLGKIVVTSEISNFIKEMINDKSSLWSIIEYTRGKTEEKVGFLGGNAITLLNNLKEDLRSRDFSLTVLSGADLSNCDLSYTCFRKSLLRNIKLSDSILKFADFSEADLTGAILDTTSKFNYFTWSPDGRYLATAGDDDIIRIWDAYTYRQLRIFCNEEDPKCLSWTRKYPLLICGNSNGSLHIWNVEDGNLYARISFYLDSISSITLCEDHLIYGDLGGHIVGYDLKPFEEGQAIVTEKAQRIKRNGKINKIVSVDPLGYIILSSGDGLEILDLNNLRTISLICKNETPFCVDKNENVIYTETDPQFRDWRKKEDYLYKLYSRKISSAEVEELYTWECSFYYRERDDIDNLWGTLEENEEYEIVDICKSPYNDDYSLIFYKHLYCYDFDAYYEYTEDDIYDLIIVNEKNLLKRIPLDCRRFHSGYHENKISSHSYSNLCYSPDGSKIAYLEAGEIKIINSDRSKDSFGEFVQVIKRNINCEGIKIHNSKGLNDKQIKFIQENSKQITQDSK